MKKKILLLLAVSMIYLSACGKEYDSVKKHIVNLPVLRTEKDGRWIGRMYTYDYNVYFDIGDGNEWEVDNSELFDLVKAGDRISVFRTDYLKDGKVVESEFEFIN